MSSLLRTIRNLGAFRPLKPPPTTKPLSTHFFNPRPPHPTPKPRHYAKYQPRTYTRYSPPPSHERSNMMILYGLMATNITIFGFGVYSQMQARQGNQLPLVKFYQRMTLNLSDFKAGSYLPLLTSIFTHLDIFHLGANMISAYFLGGFLAQVPIITPMHYFTIALGSGIAGSISYLVSREGKIEPGQRDRARGLGFSGAVMGISTVAACLAPSVRVMIWGVVPMPLWGMVAGYAAYDGYYLNDNNSAIGHAGHLGGLAFGLAYYIVRLRLMR